MSAQFKKSQKVQWTWLGRAIVGKVEEIFLKSVTKEIKGKKITRHGSKENPAYLVVSEAGNKALKLEKELAKVSTSQKKASPVRKKSATSTPSMFKS